jgi:hypothetical protein
MDANNIVIGLVPQLIKDKRRKKSSTLVAAKGVTRFG